jgi:hypothetical protein
MAGNRTLKLSILADVDDLKKKLGQGESEVVSFGDKVSDFGKKAGLAFAAATAAATAYAGKLLIDGVKSAMEDEKAQAKLATTLENVTNATKDQIAAVENQISKLSLAYGVTDEKLRPSFEKLVRATSDVTEAQKLQILALDIAAGSGRDLDSVSQALARAYDGNTSALSRLGIGLSSAELKSMSFDDVTKELADTFGGQAAAQADTFQGKITRLQVAFDEAKEAIGARLIPILTNLLTQFMDRVGPAIEFIQNKLEPLRKALEDNKEEFQALWSFLDKYVVPILSGVLKAAFSGIISSVTTLINAVGRAINFFQDLYNTYRRLVDFFKNNPLGNFLDRINPFNKTSFLTTKLDVGDEENTSGLNYSNPFFPNVPFTPTQKYLDAVARTKELKQETEAIRQRIQARKDGILDTTTKSNIIINVNSPSVIDEEGFSRAVVDALNIASDRGTGGTSALYTGAV